MEKGSMWEKSGRGKSEGGKSRCRKAAWKKGAVAAVMVLALSLGALSGCKHRAPTPEEMAGQIAIERLMEEYGLSESEAEWYVDWAQEIIDRNR